MKSTTENITGVISSGETTEGIITEVHSKSHNNEKYGENELRQL